MVAGATSSGSARAGMGGVSKSCGDGDGRNSAHAICREGLMAALSWAECGGGLSAQPDTLDARSKTDSICTPVHTDHVEQVVLQPLAGDSAGCST